MTDTMNSTTLKEFVALHAHEMDEYRGERTADMGTDQPAKWKRLSKGSLQKFRAADNDLDLYDEPSHQYGRLTDDCIVRLFCCADATALACCVTDPTDQQILFIGYTAD